MRSWEDAWNVPFPPLSALPPATPTFFLNIPGMRGCHPSGRHDWQNTCPRWSPSCWPLSFSPCQHFFRHPGIDPWGLPYHPAASYLSHNRDHLQLCKSHSGLRRCCFIHSSLIVSVLSIIGTCLCGFYATSGCSHTLFCAARWRCFGVILNLLHYCLHPFRNETRPVSTNQDVLVIIGFVSQSKPI